MHSRSSVLFHFTGEWTVSIAFERLYCALICSIRAMIKDEISIAPFYKVISMESMRNLFFCILDRLYGFIVEYQICAKLRNSDITQCTAHSDSFNNGRTNF